jgi:carotenoid cleavage dioxygenase
MTIVHDTATEKSRLIIIDAQNFTSPPLATIHLPQRVPYGAHGSWVPSGVISM